MAPTRAARPRTTPATHKNPSAQSQRAFQPLPSGDPGEDVDALRKEMVRLAASRERVYLSAAHALLPAIADHTPSLKRALRAIEVARHAHRKIERRVFTRRQFDREIADDLGTGGKSRSCKAAPFARAHPCDSPRSRRPRRMAHHRPRPARPRKLKRLDETTVPESRRLLPQPRERSRGGGPEGSRRPRSWPKSSPRPGRKPLIRPAGNGAKTYAKPRR